MYDKSLEDSRIFPFDSGTAYSLWRKALHKSGLNGKDKSINREKLHPHVLRKFFRTRLGAVIPVDIVEALMGHEGYLTEVYRRYSLEDLKKFYLKGESALLVFTEAQEVTKLRQEVEKRNEQLQDMVNGLVVENSTLKNNISNLKNRLAKMEDTDKETKEEMREIRKMLASILQGTDGS